MSDPKVTAIISADDKASATLRAIAKLSEQVAKEIEKTGRSDLSKHLDSANASAEKHIGTIRRLTGALLDLGKAGAAYAALKFPHIAKEAFLEGMHLQHEEIQLGFAGISDEDIQKAKKQIAGLLEINPNVTMGGALETFKELRSVLKHREEAPEILPTMIKAKSVLDSVDTTGGLSQGLQFLVKGAEVAGIANDPKRFEHFMDASVRAMQVMGKTISPESISELLMFEKVSGATLSDKFNQTIGLSLSQELGGSKAGNAINQFVKQITGGFQGNLHSAAKEFVSLGLARKDMFETTKTGEIKGLKPGKNLDSALLAQKDPFEWVQSVLMPALKSHGFDTMEKQLAEVRKLFPAGTAADAVAKMITQAESFQNHAKLYDEALGLNADLTKDAATQLAALNKTLKDLGAIASEPIMADFAHVMNGVATQLRGIETRYQEWAHQNPLGAKGVPVAAGLGAVAIGAAGLEAMKKFLNDAMGGKALNAAAAEQMVAARALQAAAARLGGVGVGNAAATAATVVATQGKGLLGGGGIVGVGNSLMKGIGSLFIYEIGKTGIDAGLDALPKPTMPEGYDPAAKENRSPLERIKDIFDDLARYAPKSDSDSKPETRSAREDPHLAMLRGLNSEALQPKQVHVNGEVKGEVELMNRVIIEPSQFFLAKLQEALRTQVPLVGKLGDINNGGNGPRVPPGVNTFKPTLSGF